MTPPRIPAPNGALITHMYDGGRVVTTRDESRPVSWAAADDQAEEHRAAVRVYLGERRLARLPWVDHVEEEAA